MPRPQEPADSPILFDDPPWSYREPPPPDDWDDDVPEALKPGWGGAWIIKCYEVKANGNE